MNFLSAILAAFIGTQAPAAVADTGCVKYFGNWSNPPTTACLPIWHGHGADNIHKKHKPV